MTSNLGIHYILDNSATHTGEEDYGPYSIPGGWYVTRIRAVGAISVEAVQFNITAGTYVYDAYILGLQKGAFGYSPVQMTPGATAETGDWLYQGSADAPSSPEVIAQSASSVSNWDMPRYPFKIDLLTQIWTGSLDTDFYLSVAQLISGGGFVFRTFGSIYIEYGI